MLLYEVGLDVLCECFECCCVGDVVCMYLQFGVFLVWNYVEMDMWDCLFGCCVVELVDEYVVWFECCVYCCCDVLCYVDVGCGCVVGQFEDLCGWFFWDYEYVVVGLWYQVYDCECCVVFGDFYVWQFVVQDFGEWVVVVVGYGVF